MQITVTISGRCGIGKTSLAFILRKILENRGIQVKYVNPDAPMLSESHLDETDLLNLFQSKFASHLQVEIIEVAGLKRCPYCGFVKGHIANCKANPRNPLVYETLKEKEEK